MATGNLELPLPELTDATDGEGFARVWARFELVAAAHEWSTEKQLAVLPTLLRGKLVDFYMDMDDEIKADLKYLKEALMTRAGLQPDSLTASKEFMSCPQRPGERIEDFASHLKRLYKQAFNDDNTDSQVVLQRFLTGLHPNIGRQVLIEGKPTDLGNAVERAGRIEYALQFQAKEEPADCLNLRESPSATAQSWAGLQDTLEAINKRLEKLEVSTKKQHFPRNPRKRELRKCWKCGEEGHIQYQCPLNDHRSAR
jgi:hypothetical protein